MYECEKCKKEVEVKFGSGRFCSKSCANARIQSKEIKKKISKAVKKTLSKKVKKVSVSKNKQKYLRNPKLCIVCNKALRYEQRFRKHCSIECANETISLKQKQNSYNEIIGKNIKGKHIVYKTINLLTDEFYIGVRKTEVDFDGYFGSGIRIKRSVKKYGVENFKRETLFEYFNSDDAFKKEKELIKKFKKNKLCLNLADGGQGGYTHGKRTFS